MKKISGNLLSMQIEAEQLNEYIGQVVKIHGSVYKIREMSGFAFVILRTRKTLLQCIYSEEYSSFSLSELCDNMSVVISGQVISDGRSKTGIEVRLLSYERLSASTQEAPVVINTGSFQICVVTPKKGQKVPTAKIKT